MENISGKVYQKSRDATVSISSVFPREINDRNVAGVCSGFFVTGNGYIVTNAHCVVDIGDTEMPRREALNIHAMVTNVNGTGKNYLYKCNIIGYDPVADIAVIKPVKNGAIPELNNQAFLQWSNSRDELIGSVCYTIGNPLNLDVQSITAGVIRDNKYTELNNINIESILTDYSSYEGNSGGPILNQCGRAIGVQAFGLGGGTNTIVGISGGTAQFIAQEIVETIISFDTNPQFKSPHFPGPEGQEKVYQKGYLGLKTRPLTNFNIIDLGVQDQAIRGLQVTEVDSRVKDQGLVLIRELLERGDKVILDKIDNTTLGILESQTHFTSVTWKHVAGDLVSLQFRVAGVTQEFSINATLENYPLDQEILFSDFNNREI
jgi:S1-C subfamily serine protease